MKRKYLFIAIISGLVFFSSCDTLDYFLHNDDYWKKRMQIGSSLVEEKDVADKAVFDNQYSQFISSLTNTFKADLQKANNLNKTDSLFQIVNLAGGRTINLLNYDIRMNGTDMMRFVLFKSKKLVDLIHLLQEENKFRYRYDLVDRIISMSKFYCKFIGKKEYVTEGGFVRYLDTYRAEFVTLYRDYKDGGKEMYNDLLKARGLYETNNSRTTPKKVIVFADE